jgi:DNA-binding NarL/FixJ family response regulator
VDDNKLICKGIAGLLSMHGQTVLFEANNGSDLQEKLKTSPVPDVVLLDIDMPLVNGSEVMQWLKQHYPNTKVLALALADNEDAIMQMERNGANGFIFKDCNPDELNIAIWAVMTKGSYLPPIHPFR